MPHTIEPAASGRATCRACARKIAAGELRLGERIPNAFGDEGSETTCWYHVRCGAFARPEAFLDALGAATVDIEDRETLAHEAALGVNHHRLPRARAAERAPTGRATCRHCRELIAKGEWRIALAFYEDGRFTPAGYIHIRCTQPYFETTDLLPRLRHFSEGLSDADVEELREGVVPRA